MRPLPAALRVAVYFVIGGFSLAGAEDVRSLTIDLGQNQVLELVSLAAGTFEQGSPTSEPARGADETSRTVTLTRPFFLGKYPVTRGQFARFAAETHYRTEAEIGTSGGYGWDGAKLTQRKEFTWRNPGFPQTDAHPVTLVTYNDARAFLAWLSRKAGRTFSLPTEAQWEYACRAGSTTAFPNGVDPAQLSVIAWFKGHSGDGTRPIGQKMANAWGLGDMLGNVWEWCDDWYAPYPPGPATDPRQTRSDLSDKPRRVLRGGSWMKDAAACRSAARYRNDPASRNADNGFRVVTFDAARAVAAPALPPRPRVAEPTPIALERTGPEPSTPSARSFHVETSDFPQATRTSHRGPFIMIPLLFVVLIAGFGLVLFRMLRRLVLGGGTGVTPAFSSVPSRGSSGPIRTRIVEDGFWIESSELPAGAVLDCRCVVDGQQRQESVSFQGGAGGQFVFTGSRPTSIAVSVQPGSVPETADPGAFRFEEEARREERRHSFRGHPPAY